MFVRLGRTRERRGLRVENSDGAVPQGLRRGYRQLLYPGLPRTMALTSAERSCGMKLTWTISRHLEVGARERRERKEIETNNVQGPTNN